MPDLDTSLDYCTYCPNLCRHVCPVSNAEPRETLIPRAKMATLGRLRTNQLEPTVESTASLYACTGCGACTEVCLHDVEPAAALQLGRAAAVRKNLVQPQLADLPARVDAKAQRAALAMREVLPITRFPSEAQVALLPSCDDPHGAKAAVEVLARAGAPYVAVADVTYACGGYPLLAGGHPEAFRLYAERLARQLQGYARIIVACPACAQTMKNDYPAAGVALRPEVQHLTEFLAPFADSLPVERKLPAAWYHDACFLGRHGGVYDAPRRLLGRVLDEVKEFSRSRADSECCGGGGLVPETMPETADAIAEARLVEPRESGVRTVVSACAMCKSRLARSGVVSRDLIDVLEEATRP